MTAGRTGTRPRLRPEVVLGPGLRAGPRTVHRVTDRATGCSYRMGAREHFVVRLMDGRRTTEDIARAYQEAFGRALGPDHWRQIFTMLGRHQFLADYADDAALDRLRTARETREAARTGAGTWYSRRWVLARTDRLCGTLAHATRLAFHPVLVVLGLLLATAVQAVVWTRLDTLLADAGHLPPLPVAAPAFLLLAWTLTAVHELAHGVACRHFGGRVSEIGVRWRLPLLVPYCRTDDIMLFPGRAARVGTAFAGIHAVLLLMGPLALCWALAPTGGPVRATAAVLLLFGSAGSLVALLPFLGTDGQAMLAHALGRTELGRETRRFLAHRARRAGRTPSGPAAAAERDAYTRADTVFHSLYGAAAGLAAALGYGLLMTLWYGTLRDWAGPGPAIAVLAAENAVALSVAVLVIRRRTGGTSTTERTGKEADER